MDENGDETTQEIHFFYDAQSKPAFVEFEGVKYRYIYNLQGDIIAIVDTVGTLVVEYKYDTWGNQVFANGNMVAALGELNPFRYRNYVWDCEVDLFYLRARFYTPRIGRFINADVNGGLAGKLLQHSLYTYCRNCVPKYKDPDGDAFLVTLFVALTTYAYAVLSSPDIYQDVTELALSISEGDTVGMICDSAAILLPGITSPKRGIKLISSADELAEVGKSARVVQVFDMADDLDIPHAQLHHAISKPSMKALSENLPDLAKFGFKRDEFLMLAKNADAHRGFQTWHRILNEEEVEIIRQNADKMKQGLYSREDLARDMIDLYNKSKYKNRFGGVAFK